MTEEKKDFPNFLGKIERGRLEDFVDAVEVTEKMDGSYFQFGWYNGEFRMRTKSTLDHEGIDKMFNKVMNVLILMKDDLPKDVIFCCEYFQKPKHNALAYDFSSLMDRGDDIVAHATGHTRFFLFLIEAIDLTKEWSERNVTAKLPTISFGHLGTFVHMSHLSVEDEQSEPNRMAQGTYGAVREGIVVKNSKGERFKFVTDHFKEVHGGKKRSPRKYKEVDCVWEPYVLGLRARTEKAIFRLKERGMVFGKKTFGATIGETVKDLLLEERSNLEKDVFKFYEPTFKKLVNRKIIDILFDKYRDEGVVSE